MHSTINKMNNHVDRLQKELDYAKDALDEAERRVSTSRYRETDTRCCCCIPFSTTLVVNPGSPGLESPVLVFVLTGLSHKFSGVKAVG